MKKKLRLIILVILLIVSCVYAGWISGFFLDGLKGIITFQMGKALQSKVRMGEINIYGNFAVVKDLSIKNKDYNFSSRELVLEYDLKKILSNKFDFLHEIKKATVIGPDIFLREMQWDEIEPLVAPSWQQFLFFSSKLNNFRVSFVKGRIESGSTVLKDFYLNSLISGNGKDSASIEISVKGSVPDSKSGDVFFSSKNNIRVLNNKIDFKGKFSFGDFPFLGLGNLEGTVYDTFSPKIKMSADFSSEKLQVKKVILEKPLFAAKISGALGAIKTSGSFKARKALVSGQSIDNIGFIFNDDTLSFGINGGADFQGGSFTLKKGILKKTKNPIFNAACEFLYTDYRIPFLFAVSGKSFDIGKIEIYKSSELLFDGKGKGSLDDKKFQMSMEFNGSDNKKMTAELDFPLSNRKQKKLDLFFDKTNSIKMNFSILKDEIPVNINVFFPDFSLKDQKLSTNLNVNGKVKFKKGIVFEGDCILDHLTIKEAKNSKKVLDMLRSIARLKLEGGNLTLYPQLISNRQTKGEIKFQEGKANIDMVYLFEPPIAMHGAINYSSGAVSFEDFKLNNVELGGNINLESKDIDIFVRLENEDPKLFVNIASLFVPEFRKINLEQESALNGTFHITGTIEKPMVQGDVEYKSKAVSSAKITSLKYDGKNLFCSIRVEWENNYVSGEFSGELDKDAFRFGFQGDLNLILGKIENPAVSMSAPFTLNGLVENISENPRFICDFSLRDSIINKKIGKSFVANLRYSENILEFLPPESKEDQYYPQGLIKFEKGAILFKEMCVYGGSQRKLFLNGRIFTEDKEIALDVSFAEDMKNLSLFFAPDAAETKGSLQTNLKISGDLDDPVMIGQCRFLADYIGFSGTTEALRNIKAVLNFETGVIKVDSNFFVGRTTLFLAGDMTYKKWFPEKLKLHINNDFLVPFRINIPNFADGEIAFSLDIIGDAGLPTVKGTVNVMNMSFSDWPKKVGNGLEFLAIPKWDVDITFKNNCRYYNDYVQAEIKRDAKFNFKWDNNYLYVKGQGEAERGTFVYMGLEGVLEKGSSYTVDTYVEDGVPTIRGYLYAKGSSIVDKTKINFTFVGELGKIEPIISSEPPLPRDEILALINPSYAKLSSVQIDELLRNQALDVVTSTIESMYLTRPLENVVRSTLRVDVFKVRSEMIKGLLKATSSTGVTSNPFLTTLDGASVEVGKYVFENLYVDYKAILKEEKVNSEWGVEYLFYRDLKVKYAFKPKEDPTNTEHEVFLEMSFRF